MRYRQPGSCSCCCAMQARARTVLPAPVTTRITPFRDLDHSASASDCHRRSGVRSLHKGEISIRRPEFSTPPHRIALFDARPS